MVREQSQEARISEEKTGLEASLKAALQPTLLATSAYEAIRSFILAGELKPGEWLRQGDYAQKLGISHTTVREALKRLVSEGLAEHIPHLGVRVVQVAISDLSDIYDTRMVLERLASALAAQYIRPQALRRLRELLPLTAVHLDQESAEVAQKANHDFHWTIIASTERKYLIKALKNVWDIMYTYMIVGRHWYETRTREQRMWGSVTDMEDHRKLLSALEDGDTAAAELITGNHIRASQVWMRRLLLQLSGDEHGR